MRLLDVQTRVQCGQVLRALNLQLRYLERVRARSRRSDVELVLEVGHAVVGLDKLAVELGHLRDEVLNLRAQRYDDLRLCVIHNLLILLRECFGVGERRRHAGSSAPARLRQWRGVVSAR